MKYKVGDKVRIRKDLVEDAVYGYIDATSEMVKLGGALSEISDVHTNSYYLNVDDGEYYWSDEMLEPAEEQKKVFVFPEWAKWIARDADGALWVYENEPYRNIIHSTWEAETGDAKRVPENAYTISEISWEDKPMPINLYAHAFTAIDPDDMPEDVIESLVSAAFEQPDDSNRSIYTPVTETPDPKIALHKQITEELTAIYEAKNHDYGDSFQETYRKLGLISAVTRITDKVNRLQSLSTKEQRVADESIVDTLKDCANYCIMTIIAMEVEDNA